MKTINEIKTKIKFDLNDPVECLMVQMCNKIHPLSDFIVECFKPEHKDKVVPLSEENVIALMQEYIDFAFEKAYSQRGISASRSMWKFELWLWVLEDTEINCKEYSDYGIANLKRITEKYNLVVAGNEL